jgi:peptide methionine sulfoxide reductase msrA/msrB
VLVCGCHSEAGIGRVPLDIRYRPYGGCFWGSEKLMQSLPGVVAVVIGYTNGNATIKRTLNKVITGQTGYRETVRVESKPDEISRDAILFTYFQVIDPATKNQQGNDVDTQYQTGIYYVEKLLRQQWSASRL